MLCTVDMDLERGLRWREIIQSRVSIRDIQSVRSSVVAGAYRHQVCRFFSYLLLTTAMSSTCVRLAGNSSTGPSPYLRVYVVQAYERFRNQLSRSIFLLVSGPTVPGWKLLDYVFRTSPKIHPNDPILLQRSFCGDCSNDLPGLRILNNGRHERRSMSRWQPLSAHRSPIKTQPMKAKV